MFSRRVLFVLKWVLVKVLMWTFWLGQQVFAPRLPPLPPIDDVILIQDVTTLAGWIRHRKRSAENVVAAYVRRAKAVNPSLNAVVDERFDAALEEARQVDRCLASLTAEQREDLKHSQPLLGVPFTCKEIVMMKGMNHTGGLVTRRGTKADEDAGAVARLKEAGAIALGVTNVPEVGIWCETTSTMYGRTNNPYDFTRTPGGSSGGESALLSSCGTPLAVGSDVGGSIRMPAFFTGTFGHKPSSHWVSLVNGALYPEKVRNSRVLVVGPMCRSARDLTLTMQVMAPEAARGLRAKVDHTDLSAVKIWWADGLETPACSPTNRSQSQAIKAAASCLHTAFGAPMERMVWPWDMGKTYLMWNNKMRDDYRGAPPTSVDMMDRKGDAFLLWEWLRFVCGLGRFTFGLMMMASFQKLQTNQQDPRQSPHYWKIKQKQLVEVVGENGVLLLPTMPKHYYHNELLPNLLDVSHTALFNATEMPGTSVPLGLSRDGMPLGVQVVATPGNDHLCLAVAEALEEKFGGWVSPGPVILK